MGYRTIFGGSVSDNIWVNSQFWEIVNQRKISGRFIDYIYKPNYVPDLTKLNPGDYFITDLFDCFLDEKFVNNDGSRINIFISQGIIHRKKITFNANGRFDVSTVGFVDFNKVSINFVSKNISVAGIRFKAFIDGNRFPFDFSLNYSEALEEAGVTDFYWSAIVVYYDIKEGNIKYKAYSTKFEPDSNSGFSDIDLSNQCYIAILKKGGSVRFVNSYFAWQGQQSTTDSKTKGNFILSEINEHTCNLDKVEDILGTSYEFKTVLYSKHSPIELTDYQNSYWVLGIKTGGTKEFSNILYNGIPITVECKDNTVYLISIGDSGSEYSVTEFVNFIGNPFWKTVLYKGSLNLSAGTYVCFGQNSLSYEINIPNGVIGESKNTTKIIGVSVGGYDSTGMLNLVRAVTKDISFYNIQPEVRNITSVNIENCKYEFDELSTGSASYILNFSDAEKGSVIIKNTEFIAHGRVYVFYIFLLII